MLLSAGCQQVMRGKASKKNDQSLEEKAYLYLRRRIRSGELAPGATISEASIARQLGTSRGPLREAVRRLTAEGFLRPAPAGGTAVVEFSRRDVAELYDLREALEVFAAGRTAEHGLRPGELEPLERLVADVLALRDELRVSGEPQLNVVGMRRFVRIDLQFHSLLVRAAANSRILKTVADTRVLLNIFAIRRKGHNAEELTQIHSYHSQILAAIAAKDAAGAMRLLSEHIRVSKEERLKEFDERDRDIALGHALTEISAADLY
jgi:DNA-binding GntR family transcriptional regulator